MIDFSSAGLTHLWTRFSWSVYYWLANPWAVSVSILTLLGVLSLLGVKSWKNKWVRPFIFLLLSYWLIISPPFAALAVKSLAMFVPSDPGTQGDAIVVLSRGQEIGKGRYRSAVKLLQQHRAPQLFVTGQVNIHRAARLLEEENLPYPLRGTLCAMTTYDEAQSTAAILAPQGVKTIILMTDPPHMLRSLLTFRSFGFSVIPHMTPLPSKLGSANISFLAIREYLGLISYTLLGRFHPQVIQGQPDAASVLNHRFNRNCQIG